MTLTVRGTGVVVASDDDQPVKISRPLLVGQQGHYAENIRCPFHGYSSLTVNKS